MTERPVGWHSDGRRIFALAALVTVLAVGSIVAVQLLGSPGPMPSIVAGPSIDTVGAQRWASTISKDMFALRVEAAKPTFRSDEGIDVVATVLYQGPGNGLEVGFNGLGPIEFTIPGILSPPAMVRTCSNVDIRRDAPIETQLSAIGHDGRFLLAHGLRRITAAVNLQIGGCGGAQERLETSIVVAVVDDEKDVPIWTDPRPPAACVLNSLSARVALHADDGFGFVDETGAVYGVMWPPGFTARQAPGGPLLFGPAGQIVAREGGLVLFSGTGAVAADGLVHPCIWIS